MKKQRQIVSLAQRTSSPIEGSSLKGTVEDLERTPPAGSRCVALSGRGYSGRANFTAGWWFPAAGSHRLERAVAPAVHRPAGQLPERRKDRQREPSPEPTKALRWAVARLTGRWGRPWRRAQVPQQPEPAA